MMGNENVERKFKPSFSDIMAFAFIASVVTKSAGYLIRAIKMPNGNKKIN